jgi:hypothetical protein
MRAKAAGLAERFIVHACQPSGLHQDAQLYPSPVSGNHGGFAPRGWGEPHCAFCFNRYQSAGLLLLESFFFTGQSTLLSVAALIGPPSRPDSALRVGAIGAYAS